MSLLPTIQQMKNSSRTAQENFYLTFSKMMFMVCRRYISIDVIAQEVMMDGFLKFYETVKDFKYVDDRSTGAYLKKIMVNECLMHLRKEKKEKEEFIIEPLELAEDVPIEEFPALGISREEVHLLIALLPEDLRIVFNSVLDGYTHDEIGAVLGFDRATSTKKYHRAKQLLKELILKKINNGQRRKSN